MTGGKWTTRELLHEASRLGLKLTAKGDKLSVVPAQRCTPDFARVLRQHKRALLDWLEKKTVPLSADQVPWLYIARQVLSGEFDGADDSTADSIRIGLRSVRHPLCLEALARLHN